MQHDVGSQVVSLGVLNVVLRFVVDALDERRTVQDRFQQHFAPVALHFRIAFQCVRQVRGLGRDAPVEFHQVFQLGLQFAALCRLGGVDVLDALSEFGDVVAEGFEQHVERFFVGLLEMFGLLAQYLGCKVAELGPEGLLQFFALGFFGRAILGVLRAQRCDLGLGRGAECRQFRFGACPLLGQRLHLSFVALPQLFFRGQGLFRGGQPGFGHRQPRRGIALAGFGGLVISGKPSGVPAPQHEEQCDGTARLHVAANMKRVVGVIACFCVCFHAKIAIYSRKNIPSRDMRDNLAPQRNFYPLCRRLFRNFL